jgi:hypothetical protein
MLGQRPIEQPPLDCGVGGLEDDIVAHAACEDSAPQCWFLP